MTLTELRARLRAELGDETAGAYVWSDPLLDGFLGDAIQRLGEDVPLEKESSLTVGADGSYALPADLVRLRGVKVGDSALLPGEYTVWAGKLTLHSPSAGPATVRYTAARSRPSVTGDIGLRAGEELPVLWLASAHAMAWLAKQREKAGAGGSSGAVSQAYAQRYERWLVARRRPLRRIVPA